MVLVWVGRLCVPIPIASGVPRSGMAGSDEAGSLVESGEESFFGFFVFDLAQSLNSICLSFWIVFYP
jgi:hypothetical protein